MAKREKVQKLLWSLWMKENFSAVFAVLFSDAWAWEGMKRKAWERLAGFQKGWKTATLHWCSINLKFWLVAERITVEGKGRCGLLDAALKWLLQFFTTLKLHHSDGNPSVKKTERTTLRWELKTSVTWGQQRDRNGLWRQKHFKWEAVLSYMRVLQIDLCLCLSVCLSRPYTLPRIHRPNGYK